MVYKSSDINNMKDYKFTYHNNVLILVIDLRVNICVQVAEGKVLVLVSEGKVLVLVSEDKVMVLVSGGNVLVLVLVSKGKFLFFVLPRCLGHSNEEKFLAWLLVLEKMSGLHPRST